MSLTPITFRRACRIVKESVACIVGADGLSYPKVNEGVNGKNIIEVSFDVGDGKWKNTFDRQDTYYITNNGCLEIDKHDGTIYFLQFLAPIKVQ